jgi:thiol-disulfide isomerase/thioredoxin
MKLIALALLILFFPALAAAQSPSAPQLALKNLNGHEFRLSDYKGKVVLINFWATWCPPCRQEIPDLIKLQRTYGKQGLQIVGITYPPEELPEVRRFARRLKINYPIAIGTKASKELFTSSDTLPLTVVIDRNGSVSEIIEGVMYPDEFEEKVKPLLSTAKR